MIMNIHFVPYIGCFNIHWTYVPANNSTNNNVFFWYQIWKLYTINCILLILHHNALDKRGKIFCITTYLETKERSVLKKAKERKNKQKGEEAGKPKTRRLCIFRSLDDHFGCLKMVQAVATAWNLSVLINE